MQSFRTVSPFRAFDLSDIVFRMGWVPNLVFLRYGPQFQIHRRLFHRYFGPHEAPSYFPYQEHEARILVKNLLATDPKNYDECFRR